MGVTYLTTQQAAEFLDVSIRSIQKYVKDGLLPSVKNGRDHLIHPKHVREFKRPCGKRGRKPRGAT